jgi:hypothetical protein
LFKGSGEFSKTCAHLARGRRPPVQVETGSRL